MAYDFNGSSQSLIVTSTPVTATPLTIAAFVNSDNAAGLGTICNVCTNTASNFNSYRLRLFENKIQALALNTDASGVGIASSAASAVTGTWHHAAGVFNSSSSRFAYLDGVKSTENTTSVTVTGLAAISVAWTPEGSNVQYLDGRLAEVAIWNSALTDAEILSLARGFTPDQIRPQSLQFYAPLVRNLQDVRGGRTITNNNSATVAVHPRIIT